MIKSHIEKKRIYRNSDSRAAYELSQPILDGQAKVIAVEKLIYRVLDESIQTPVAKESTTKASEIRTEDAGITSDQSPNVPASHQLCSKPALPQEDVPSETLSLEEKIIDFLVAAWTGPLAFEATEKTKEPMTWSKFDQVGSMKIEFDRSEHTAFLK